MGKPLGFCNQAQIKTISKTKQLTHHAERSFFQKRTKYQDCVL